MRNSSEGTYRKEREWSLRKRHILGVKCMNPEIALSRAAFLEEGKRHTREAIGFGHGTGALAKS